MFHVTPSPTHTILSAEVASCACSGKPRAPAYQLDVVKRNAKRPRLKNRDRLIWIILARFWSDWRKPLILFKPETVIRWHKKGFRLYWRWKSRGKWPGRRAVPNHVRDLIRMMSRDNPLWGAPRIHGELLKLGSRLARDSVQVHSSPPEVAISESAI